MKIFTGQGNFIERYGLYGHSDGMFAFPIDLDVDPQNNILYIAEKGAKRVQAFRISINNESILE